MKTEKPLPCPFCGETPRIEPTDWRAEGDAWAAVSCDNEDCDARPSMKNWANLATSGARSHAQQKRVVIAKWNLALRAHSPTNGDRNV